MTKAEIVELLAADGVVEQMCKAIAHQGSLTPDLEDLAQIVYLILLDYDEAKIVDLWETGAIRFFLARVIKMQYCGNRTEYFKQVRKFRLQAENINEYIRKNDK